MLVAGLALGAAGFASTETAKDPIKTRHDLMEGIGEAMGGLAAIAKQEAPFDAAVVADKAGTIASNLERAAKLFPEGSDKGEFPTRAKAEVWSKREGFEQGMKNAHAAALALKAVTEEAAFMPALGKLGGACRGCHDTYRTPEE
jgi:cytochrome c556